MIELKRQPGWQPGPGLRGWGGALLCLTLTTSAAWSASFTASLDRDAIMLGESATLSLKFEGGQPKVIPDLSGVPNLQLTSLGQSSQFSFVNGASTSTISYNFAVTARQPGDYVIPALGAVVDGQTLTSPTLKLRVLKPAAASPEAVASGNELAFMKLNLLRKDPSLWYASQLR